jgi:hypothetical protein
MKLTKWPYIKKPLIISIIIGGGVFFISIFQDLDILIKTTKTLNGVIINVSLTFIAFSITALSLISFVYNQEWFKKLSDSIYFKSFIDRFFWSTKLSLILLMISVASILIEPCYSPILCSCINTFFISSFLFISIWTWTCVDDLIDIYRDS